MDGLCFSSLDGYIGYSLSADIIYTDYCCDRGRNLKTTIEGADRETIRCRCLCGCLYRCRVSGILSEYYTEPACLCRACVLKECTERMDIEIGRRDDIL